MHLFGITHLLWLLGTGLAAAVLAILAGRGRAVPAMRISLAALLAGAELLRYYTDGFPFPYGLPFNLCNVSAWVAVLACATLSPLAIEFVYFTGIAGAGMALITPDMGHDWPTRFFVAHGALLVTAVTLTKLSPLRRGATWRAYGLLLLYIGLVGIFDWRAKANFAYLRRKPQVSALSFMGPWPYYILVAAVVALLLFWLLWLPVRGSAQGEASASEKLSPGGTSPSADARTAST